MVVSIFFILDPGFPLVISMYFVKICTFGTEITRGVSKKAAR